MDTISYSLAAKALKGLTGKADVSGLSVVIPRGTTAERPTLGASESGIRFNTDNGGLEQWDGSSWSNVSADITATNLQGTDTEANILAMSGMVAEDLWIASDTLDGWVYDGSSWINIGPLQGPQGIQGEQGNGITSIARTSGDGSAGTTDTYTITYADATTTTFDVYNGANGQAIDHISRISGDGSAGTTDTYAAYLDAGETQSVGTFSVYNGNNGTDVDHVSLTSGTGASGTTDTYTLWADAGETVNLGTFTVYNGANGTGTVASVVGGTNITIDNTDPANPIINNVITTIDGGTF